MTTIEAEEIRADFAARAAETYAAADEYEARGDLRGAASLRRSADSLARMAEKPFEAMPIR